MKARHSKEFNDFCSRVGGAVAAATRGFASENSADLWDSYRAGIRFVFSVLGVFILDSRQIGNLGQCCRLLREMVAGDGNWSAACREMATLARTTGVDLLASGGCHTLHAADARESIIRLLASETDPALGSVYFSTVPPSWISLLYEYLLDRRPEAVEEPPGVALRADSSSRKRNGAFFTPGYIVDYIVRESLGRLPEPLSARVLDPAMGAGDFLVSAVRFLASRESGAGGADGRDGARPLHRKAGTEPGHYNATAGTEPGHYKAAAECVYGCDIDPIAVDIARFLVWLESGGTADARTIARHLICADAIAGDGRFVWEDAFPDAFGLYSGEPGFDAVIGNPPYVASKNASIAGHQEANGVRGQSDYYLIFLSSVLQNQLVRQGGGLAMVLPDPFLVRANAARVRRSLLEKWSVRSIVHVAGAFRGAQVANIILVSQNRPSDGRAFPVLRLENTPERRSFELDPELTESRQARKVRPSFALAQPRSEVLYLVDEDYRARFQAIHGPENSLARIAPPFMALEELDIVDRVFRGEEIGKRKILQSSGELPILLGGESIRRGRLVWDGSGISRAAVRKPLELYQSPKILMQKSSDRVVAALDEKGFIVPQSVYGIRLVAGRYHPLYLLVLLNSELMSDYVLRAFTGYKMVQPQIELEDVRRLPVRTIDFEANPVERVELAAEASAVFDSELTAGPGRFTRLRSSVVRLLGLGHTDSVHDLLVHIAERAYGPRDVADAAPYESERAVRAMNLVVEHVYSSN